MAFFIVTLDGGKTAADLSISEVDLVQPSQLIVSTEKKRYFKICKVSKKCISTHPFSKVYWKMFSVERKE